jgi:hypothetical protein
MLITADTRVTFLLYLQVGAYAASTNAADIAQTNSIAAKMCDRIAAQSSFNGSSALLLQLSHKQLELAGEHALLAFAKDR